MVDIQHCTLSSFIEDRSALSSEMMEVARDITEHGFDLFADALELGQFLGEVQWRLAVVLAENEVVEVQQVLESLFQKVRIEKVTGAKPTTVSVAPCPSSSAMPHPGCIETIIDINLPGIRCACRGKIGQTRGCPAASNSIAWPVCPIRS